MKFGINDLCGKKESMICSLPNIFNCQRTIIIVAKMYYAQQHSRYKLVELHTSPTNSNTKYFIPWLYRIQMPACTGFNL